MNRRDFLKLSGRAGLLAAGSLYFPGFYQAAKASSEQHNDKNYKREMLKKELEPNLDSLTRKIIELESNWRYWAVGNSRDIGLMQITPIVLKEWNNNKNKNKYTQGDLFHPLKNLEVGEWYLHEKIGGHYLPHYKLPFTEENKAACYNAGPSLIGRIGDATENFDRLPRKTQNYLIKLWNLPEKA